MLEWSEKEKCMKAILLFSGSGPILLLSSYPTLDDERFAKKLKEKGINKYIAFEVPLDEARGKYRNRFAIISHNLEDKEDMEVLDYNGFTAFNNFHFDVLDEPIKKYTY